MKLTAKQEIVLNELRNMGRENAYRYRDSQPYLHQRDCEKLRLGDQRARLERGRFNPASTRPEH
jgi:hypothetical protein